MCREPIADGAACLEAVACATPTDPMGKAEQARVHISQEIRHWQQQMAKLLQRQLEKGGLIDINAKDEVIDETWTWVHTLLLLHV